VAPATSGTTATTTGTTATTTGTTTTSTTSSPRLTKLVAKDTKVGTGRKAANGDILEMAYVGKLADGTQFDANDDDSKPPLVMTLGAGEVIAGWDQGLLGMQAGGERDLEVPPDLGYGPVGQGPIPPNADLYFHVKVLHVMSQTNQAEVIQHDGKVGSGRAVKKGDKVVIKYTATFLNGHPYDVAPNYSFEVGSGLVLPAKDGKVLPGLNAGVLGMKVGGVRKLTIPASLGYGSRGAGGVIPPDATLVFEVELLGVR
jgi:peptidylprolyl isomerase